MDNRVRRFVKSFEIDGQKVTLVASEGNICFVLIGKDLIPDWRVKNSYLCLKLVDDNRLLNIVRDIIKHNPKLPPAGRYEPDDRNISLYAKEGIGYVMIVKKFNDNLYVASQIDEHLSKSVIESIQDDPVKFSDYAIKNWGEERIIGSYDYLWLKDRVVARKFSPLLQITGKFNCKYCGQVVEVKSITNNVNTAKCHNCGLIYGFETPNIALEIDADALEYGFDMEADNESE